MSVILDALRRQRRSGSPEDSAVSHAAADQVPAGLGLPGRSPAPAGVRSLRRRLLGLGLLLVIGLGVWAAIQVSRTLMTTYVPPAQTTAPQPPAEGAPAPLTSPPPASVQPEPRAEPSPEQPESTVVLRSARRQDSRPSPPPAQPPTPAQVETPSQDAAGKTPVAEQDRPRDEVNHFELAVRYQTSGNYDEALKHYLAVLAADEFNVEARNNLGLLYRQRRQSAEAIEQFRRALAANPQYVTARSNLAVVLMEAGRLTEARAELRAAAAVEPRNADLLVNLALVEKADRHRDEAIELLLRALGHQPRHAMAHYNLAVLYEEQGAIVLACDHYTEFLKYAGPDRGELLSEVQRRLTLLAPTLANTP